MSATAAESAPKIGTARDARGTPGYALVAALCIVPLLLAPYSFAAYATNALALFLIYGLLAMSLNFIWGYAGIASFGQNAFFGIGAYVYGIVALNALPAGGGTAVAIAAGVLAATVVAALIGYLMFYGRISDVYASVTVLVLSLVLYSFAVSTAGDEWVIGIARLGGFNGVFGQGETRQNIANFQIPHITLLLPWARQPFVFRIDRNIVSGYYLVLGTCVGAFAVATLLLQTRLGRVAAAIRENEARAASLGYETRLYKLTMFAIAGAIAGLAGVLFASWGRFVNPDVFTLTFASSVIVYSLLGGRHYLLGAFLGAIALNLLTSWLGGLSIGPAPAGGHSAAMAVLAELGRRSVQQAPVLVQGAALVIAVLLLREGMVSPLLRSLRRWPRIGWLVLLPLVVAWFAGRAACRQAGVCLL